MSVITYSKIMSKHTHALLRCVKRPLAVYSSRMISLSDLKFSRRTFDVRHLLLDLSYTLQEWTQLCASHPATRTSEDLWKVKCRMSQAAFNRKQFLFSWCNLKMVKKTGNVTSHIKVFPLHIVIIFSCLDVLLLVPDGRKDCSKNVLYLTLHLKGGLCSFHNNICRTSWS